MAQQSLVEKMRDTSAADANKRAIVNAAAAQVDQGLTCSAKVEQTLDIPAGGLLTKVEVAVLALDAGECPLKDVGEIRSSPDDAAKAVIDLKRMRSVSGLSTPLTMSKIATWTGTGFDTTGRTVNTKKARFSELATEKLLVTFSGTVDIEDLTNNGTILLPDAPADLVLTINGKTAWTHIGPVKLTTSEKQPVESRVSLDAKAKDALITGLLDALPAFMARPESGKVLYRLLEEYGITLSNKEKAALVSAFDSKRRFKRELNAGDIENWLTSLGVTWESQNKVTAPAFQQNIDLTQMLQDEINNGATTIRLELRAALACRLQLSVPTLEYLCGHDVVFPAQALTLEIGEESTSTLSLPLPNGSNTWLARQTTFTLAGNISKSRFFPAVGPQAIDLGELLLDSDHALAALLTKEMLAAFQNLEGIRLPVVVMEGGVEITAFIHSDDNGKVGLPLNEAVFRSQTLDQKSQEQWVLLALNTPFDIPPDMNIWVEIRVIRGSCWWQLGGKSGETEGVVTLQRGVPGAAFSALTLTLDRQSRHFQGRLRLKGQPVTEGAIPAIRFFDPQSQAELQGLTTGNAPIDVTLEFTNGIHPTGDQLNIPVLFHAPGTYTITKARVIYEE